MGATAHERVRASRLRKKIRAGKSVPPEDRTWLDAYTAARASGPGRKAQPLPDTPAIPPSGGVAASDEPGSAVAPDPSARPEPTATPPLIPDPPNEKSIGLPVISFDAPKPATTPATPTPDPATPGATCGDKNCVRCQHPPDKTCPVHGTPIHARMNKQAARHAAQMLLAGLDFLLRIRFPGIVLQPIPPERLKSLADGIEEASHRRAGWVSQWDDILLLGGSLGGHGMGRAAEINAHIAREKSRDKTLVPNFQKVAPDAPPIRKVP